VRKRIERLSDLGPLTSCFFSGRLNVPESELRSSKLDDNTLRQAFQIAIWQFDGLSAWDASSVEATLRHLAAVLHVKLRDMLRPFYIALTGSAVSVPLFDAAAILGRDLSRERLRDALNRLGGVTAEEASEWRKSLALNPEESTSGETM
jgi:glutamyl-tRNA synthetase